jgi:hypothetical protein
MKTYFFVKKTQKFLKKPEALYLLLWLFKTSALIYQPIAFFFLRITSISI